MLHHSHVGVPPTLRKNEPIVGTFFGTTLHAALQSAPVVVNTHGIDLVRPLPNSRNFIVALHLVYSCDHVRYA